MIFVTLFQVYVYGYVIHNNQPSYIKQMYYIRYSNANDLL